MFSPTDEVKPSGTHILLGTVASLVGGMLTFLAAVI